MPQPAKPPRNFHTIALVLHGLLAVGACNLLIMFLPVVLGAASGEGAGMGVFLILYFLGIPLVIVAAAATIFSIHSPRPGLLVPTVLLWSGAIAFGASEHSLAAVLFSAAYIAAVVRAVFLSAGAQGQRSA